MEERKTLNSEMSFGRQLEVVQERRAHEVKRNFAIGIQRPVSAKGTDQDRCLKTRIKS